MDQGQRKSFARSQCSGRDEATRFEFYQGGSRHSTPREGISFATKPGADSEIPFYDEERPILRGNAMGEWEKWEEWENKYDRQDAKERQGAPRREREEIPPKGRTPERRGSA
jgi:hypothetical protein